jgi:hypothetical protein
MYWKQELLLHYEDCFWQAQGVKCIFSYEYCGGKFSIKHVMYMNFTFFSFVELGVFFFFFF